MKPQLLVFSIFVSIAVFIYIINLTRKNLLNEKESIFWVFGAFGVIILSIFPTILDWISKFIGVEYPPTTLFLMSTIMLVVIVFRQFTKISKLENKMKDSISTISILDFELRRLLEEKSREVQ